MVLASYLELLRNSHPYLFRCVNSLIHKNEKKE